MQDSIHKPVLPYGAALSHDYPRSITLAAVALVGLVLGIVVGVTL